MLGTSLPHSSAEHPDLLDAALAVTRTEYQCSYATALSYNAQMAAASSQHDVPIPISALQLNRFKSMDISVYLSQAGSCSGGGGGSISDVTPASSDSSMRRMSMLSAPPSAHSVMTLGNDKQRAWQSLQSPAVASLQSSSVVTAVASRGSSRSATPITTIGLRESSSPAVPSSPLSQPSSPLWCTLRVGPAGSAAAVASTSAANTNGQLALLPTINSPLQFQRRSVDALSPTSVDMIRGIQTAPTSFTSDASGRYSPPHHDHHRHHHHQHQHHHHGHHHHGHHHASPSSSGVLADTDGAAAPPLQQLQRAARSDAYRRVTDSLLSEPGVRRAMSPSSPMSRGSIRSSGFGEPAGSSLSESAAGGGSLHRVPNGMSAHARRFSAMQGDFGDGSFTATMTAAVVSPALQAKRPTSPQAASRRNSGVIASVSASQLGRRSAVDALLDADGGDLDKVHVVTGNVRGALATSHLHGMSTAFLTTHGRGATSVLPTIAAPSTTTPGDGRQQALYNGHLQRVLYNDSAAGSTVGGTAHDQTAVVPKSLVRNDDDGYHAQESSSMRKMIGGFTKRLKKGLVERKLAFKKLLN